MGRVNFLVMLAEREAKPINKSALGVVMKGEPKPIKKKPQKKEKPKTDEDWNVLVKCRICCYSFMKETESRHMKRRHDIDIPDTSRPLKPPPVTSRQKKKEKDRKQSILNALQTITNIPSSNRWNANDDEYRTRTIFQLRKTLSNLLKEYPEESENDIVKKAKECLVQYAEYTDKPS